MAQLRVSYSGVKWRWGFLKNISHPLGFSNYFTEYCVTSVWANEVRPEYQGIGLAQPWLLQPVSLILSMR